MKIHGRAIGWTALLLLTGCKESTKTHLDEIRNERQTVSRHGSKSQENIDVSGNRKGMADFEIGWSKLAEEGKRFQFELMSFLAGKGKHNDLLDSILKNTSPGELRAEYIAYLFSCQDNLSLEELRLSINRLSDTSDRKAALNGMLAAMDMGTRNHQFSEFSLIDPKSFGFEQLLRKYVTSSVNNGVFDGPDGTLKNNFFQICDELKKLKQRGTIDDGVFFGAVGDLARQKDLGIFAYQLIVQNQQLSSVPKNVMQAVLQAAASDQGVSFLQKMSNDNISDPESWGAVFNELARRDVAALQAWRSQGHQIPLFAENAYQSAIGIHNASNGDFKSARLAIEKIKDSVIKDKVTGQIWTKERDSLRKSIVQNPAETVAAIVSGQSKYADYWLEEAISTWVQKDFDKAQEWYQQNWKSLPPSKSQYVAAAFATQALNQGDANTARQWVALIQDPKTKQRIQDRADRVSSGIKK